MQFFLRMVGLIAANVLFAGHSVAAEPQRAPKTMTAEPAREDTSLVVEATRKYKVKSGEDSFAFAVSVKNVAEADASILQVRTSCGCSVAVLPHQPWVLRAGETGTFEIQVDLRGKSGTLVKSAFIDTARGTKQFSFIIDIASDPASEAERRERGVQIATADRQAVFRGSCAVCHGGPTLGLTGEALFTAACGICHEAEHRASMVPDLRALPLTANRDYWRTLIVAGKPGTLMPGFSSDMGGPLSRAQIDSLVEYLVGQFTPNPAAAKPANEK